MRGLFSWSRHGNENSLDKNGEFVEAEISTSHHQTSNQENSMRMSFDIQKKDIAEAIAELDHSEIIGLVLEVLSQCATVELDEELVARMWPTIAACYDEEEEKPTLEDLMRRYQAR